MSCCNSKSNITENLACPVCNEEGVLLNVITLQSLLKAEFVKEIDDKKPYRYCRNKECLVCYFSGLQTFNTASLKIKVTQKDPGLDVPVCYCFNYTREMIFRELESTKKSNILDEIKLKMKNPGCFCERSNPQGSCCLGNVMAWILEAKNMIRN